MKNCVIIGNSASGIAAAEGIRSKDKESKITIITDENYLAYCRCLISYYLAGDVKEDKLSYRGQKFYSENKIELILNKKAVRINPKKNQVTLDDKTQINYDYLILAHGASSNMPDIKGINKRGVFGFRTLDDIKGIKDLLPIADTACILGGGLIGLKAAYALKKKGLEIKVIVRSNQVLSQMVDETAAALFKKRLEGHGIEILAGCEVTEILGNGDAKAVRLNTGKVLASSIIIAGKGVIPNIDLVRETDIKTNRGILTDEYLRTNIENIFACGDVCENFDIATGHTQVNSLWPNAVEQGKIAGLNSIAENIIYDGSLGMNSVEFFDLPVISMGITRLKDKQGYEEQILKDEKRDIYKKILLKDNRLVGAIFVGQIQNAGVYLRLIRQKTDISKIKDELLSHGFSYAKVKDIVEKEDKIYV